MVRLNNQGLNVPVKMEDLKKLPLIPNTGARIKSKHNTDMQLSRDYHH